MSRQSRCVNTPLHIFQKQEPLLPPGVRKLEKDVAFQHMSDVIWIWTFSCGFKTSYSYEDIVFFPQIKTLNTVNGDCGL